MCAPAAGTSLPPGTPTIPLSQLQHHSLALQGQHGQTLATASQPQQGQQAVFRFPAAVSLTGDLLCMLPRLCLLLLISHICTKLVLPELFSLFPLTNNDALNARFTNVSCMTTSTASSATICYPLC